MSTRSNKSGFLTYIPADWAHCVKWAARDTGLDVYCTPEDGKVAVRTTETCSLTPFWTRFRELRDE